jgi:predicted metal-binding membrane protein
MDRNLAQWEHYGVAAVAATRDERLRPQVVRAWGLKVAPDGASAAICLGASPDSQTLANIAANGAISVSMVIPSSYRMIQMKGRVTAVAEPTAEQLARVEAHAAAFVAEVEPVGLTAEQARRFVHRDLVAVSFSVAEVYDQTPGPGAGARL